MKIADVVSNSIGTAAKINCVVSGKTVMSKKNGEEFFVLELQDNTGKISMPVWNKDGNEWVEQGTFLTVTGKRNEYNGTPRLDMTKIEKCSEKIALSEFVPAYDIPKSMFNYFNEYVLKIKDARYRAMLEYILGIDIRTAINEVMILNPTKWNRFISAPCAAKHHGSKVGGLFVHTIGVMKAVENIICDYMEQPFYMQAEEKHMNPDRLRFLAVLHDFNKQDEYLWDVQISYNKEMKVGHEVLLLGTLARANGELGEIFSTKEMSEIYAIILLHHGQWGQYQPKQWDEHPVEAKILHAADLIDSQIIGKIEELRT